MTQTDYFAKGCSHCMMAVFQNRLISLIFGVFSSRFLHRTSLIWLNNRFWHVFFLILIFDPNWLFCKGYSLCMMAVFQTCLISLIFGVLSNGFLHRTTLTWLKNRLSHPFLILIFDPNWLFCKGYNLCMMAVFQNRLISLIFGVFSSGFLHRATLIWLKNPFWHVFLNFNLWPKLTIFAKAIAFAWWPFFKLVSFL